MMNKVKKVVVVGGGTAGWISASVVKKVLGDFVDVELVESDAVGTVGVGEATIPPIRLLNNMLGLSEADFVRETKASFKLAIKFENWRVKGESYYHTFGAPGKTYAFCHFHHLLKRAQMELGDTSSVWDYDLNYLCAEAGKFGHIKTKDPVLELPYAYHFDAGLYAKFLRKLSESMGVVRTEGFIEHVEQNKDSGYIESVILKSGQKVSGDLFIDCSGFRGLLIQQKLNTGYEDWTHWLPCDRAVAVPSERFENTLPYTRAIAHDAGWQWRIPLQHRNGNGLVYSSHHYTDQQALDTLLSNLDSTAIGDPNFIKFRTGRARKQWNKNVIAVGLASGFLEPLESTSIHLIQSAATRLLQLFPHNGIDQKLVDQYNLESQREYEQIRDFIILHYHVNEREDTMFWKDLRNMEVPESLTHKIELYRANGRIFREQNDLFLEPSWLQVMLGQGVEAQDYSPIAKTIARDNLDGLLRSLRTVKNDPVPKLSTHDQFIEKLCGR